VTNRIERVLAAAQDAPRRSSIASSPLAGKPAVDLPVASVTKTSLMGRLLFRRVVRVFKPCPTLLQIRLTVLLRKTPGLFFGWRPRGRQSPLGKDSSERDSAIYRDAVSPLRIGFRGRRVRHAVAPVACHCGTGLGRLCPSRMPSPGVAQMPERSIKVFLQCMKLHNAAWLDESATRHDSAHPLVRPSAEHADADTYRRPDRFGRPIWIRRSRAIACVPIRVPPRAFICNQVAIPASVVAHYSDHAPVRIAVYAYAVRAGLWRAGRRLICGILVQTARFCGSGAPPLRKRRSRQSSRQSSISGSAPQAQR